MDNIMLKSALFYHTEGLDVIPVKPGEKAPALAAWEEYQTRCSTEDEVCQWFGNGSNYNIGIVHGAVSGNYITIDFDHDQGIFGAMRRLFPSLFMGRLEQSGSLEGFHLPLRLDVLPDFGHDNRQKRPRGNRTWKTGQGDVNCRIQFCQTVAPPSLHPSGNRYRFLQKGDIISIPTLDSVIEWLNSQAPSPARSLPAGSRPATHPIGGNDLLAAVLEAWPTALSVFEHFGLVKEKRVELDGEIRLLGNGGLLIAADDPAIWYNFSDETGGHIVEAWGWCRFGSAYDNGRHFRQVLIEMAQTAGIDTAQFHRRGDEKVSIQCQGDRQYWSRQVGGWDKMRVA